MVGDGWLRELQELRSGGGERRRYRARVREIRRAAWESPAALMLWRLMRDGKERDRVSILLYPETASPGDPPLIAIPVQADGPWELIQRGDHLEARGTPEPGHAMVIDLAGRAIDCAGPAFAPTFFRRLYRL
jgi:hypothetical protein